MHKIPLLFCENGYYINLVYTPIIYYFIFIANLGSKSFTRFINYDYVGFFDYSIFWGLFMVLFGFVFVLAFDWCNYVTTSMIKYANWNIVFYDDVFYGLNTIWG